MNFKVTQTGCTGPQFGQNWGKIQKSGSKNRQEKKERTKLLFSPQLVLT
jgi:hypothetical protein